MGQGPIDAVLAGTKGFAVALLAPLTAKVGTRPRVAGDPGQVLGLVNGPSSLVVIEFTGEGSLGAVQALVRDGRGVRVVAGVPPAHAGAEGTLRALGVEVGIWDGKVDGVIGAVERTIALMNGGAARPAPIPGAAPAAARAPPAGAGPAPRPGAAPLPQAQQPAAGPARAPTAPAAQAPTAPRVAAAAPPRPQPAGAQGAPRPAPAAAVAHGPTAPRVAPRPAVPTAPRPAAPEAAPRPAPPPAPRPAAATAPRAPAAPAAPHPVTVPAAPRALVPPPPPAAGRPGGAAPSPAARAPAVVAPSPAPAAPVPPRPAAELFDDLDAAMDVDVGPAAAPAARPADLHSPGVYVPPPPDARLDWPAGTSSAAAAEDALRRALGGAGAGPLHELALRTLDTLSELERAVLSGEPQPVDAGPIRSAAVMRLRVAEALAGVPAPGSPVDSAALSAILGEIDHLLADVAPLVTAAPPELAPALQEIRNTLVREAIDFSEAASQVSAQPGAPAALPASRAPRAARVLSITSGDARTEPRRWSGRTVALVVVVLLLAVGVAAYHVRRLAPRPGPPLKTVAGAPAGTTASERNGVQFLSTVPGQRIDPAELERFKAAQEAKGNTLEEIGKGVWLIKPATKGANP